MKIQTIHRRVFSLLPAITSSTTPKEMSVLLKRAFRNNSSIRFRSVGENKFGNIIAWGTFDITDDDCPRITVTLCSFEIETPVSHKELLFRIFEILAHEHVHLSQHKKAHGCPRRYKEIHPMRAYYGRTIEIDAFGLSSALQQVCMGNDTVAEQYRQLFSFTDPRFKRFLKKRWKHMQTLPKTIYINRDYATIQASHHN